LKENDLRYIEIAIFTEEGNKKFIELLSDRPANLLDLVDTLADSSEHTKKLKVNMELKSVRNRYELAEHLWSYVNPESQLFNFVGDTYFWNWMAAAWMSTLINLDNRSDLNEKLGKQIERWVLTENVLRYHRHLVSGAYFAYQTNFPNIDNAMCLLATDVLAPGEVVERIAGKRSLSTGEICHLATLLYFDPEEKSLRKGVTSPPGNPKAFSRYFSQIDLTVDYEGMSAEELLKILPYNFEKWVRLGQSDLKKISGRPQR
jgi:hypothetical protein